MELKRTVSMCLVVAFFPLFAGAQGRTPEAAAALSDMKQTLGVTLSMVRDMPDENVAPFWEQLKSLQLNPNTVLSGKTKELIGLGVAAQVPCRYCVYAHSAFAKVNGASEREIKEAVATAAIAREVSALSNGQSGSSKEAATSGDPIWKEIEKVFGSTPEFLKRYPSSALMSLWQQMKAVPLNASGAMSVKDKALLSLAVVSQLPSLNCVKEYSAMARSNGATEEELQEAVAMAGLTRAASTILNGSLTDEASWRRDIDQVVKHVTAPKRAAAR